MSNLTFDKCLFLFINVKHCAFLLIIPPLHYNTDHKIPNIDERSDNNRKKKENKYPWRIQRDCLFKETQK